MNDHGADSDGRGQTDGRTDGLQDWVAKRLRGPYTRTARRAIRHNGLDDDDDIGCGSVHSVRDLVLSSSVLVVVIMGPGDKDVVIWTGRTICPRLL